MMHYEPDNHYYISAGTSEDLNASAVRFFDPKRPKEAEAMTSES